jgi:uncharacterized protein (TIGR00251 family)
MVTITEHPEGFLVVVRAQPGARRNAIVGEVAGALKVAVTAPAQDGRANKAIVETLRDALQLKRSQVAIASGETSRHKLLLVQGIALQELQRRIESLL